MSALVDNLYLKIQHADNNAQEIDRLMYEMFAGGLAISTEFNEEVGETTFVLNESIEVNPAISVRCGEVAHQLRSCLDHIVFYLASRANPPLSDGQLKQIEYPIFVDQNRFSADVGRKLRGLPSSAIDIIERFQPFHAVPPTTPTTHPLWLLHEMNRIDKHRALHVVSAVGTARGVSLEGQIVNGEIIIQAPPRAILEKGKALMKVKGAKATFQNGSVPSVHIAFEEVGGFKDGPVLPILCGLRDFTIDLIAALTSYEQSKYSPTPSPTDTSRIANWDWIGRF